MNIITKLVTAIVAATLPGSGPPEPRTLLDIEIRSTGFAVQGHSYATAAELTAALEKLPPPDEISLTHAESATPERHDQAIAAIKNAGITAPVAWVGNEVFY